MKKFTKVCLWAAGGLFGLGLLLFLIFGLIDGFTTIYNLDADPGFPVSFGLSLLDGDRWEEIRDDFDMRNRETDADRDGSSQKEETATYQAADVRNLDFDLHACVLEILPAKGQDVELSVEENMSQIRYRLDDGTLTMKGKYSSDAVWKIGKDGNAPVIKLYLPENMSFDSVNMEIGIGEVTMTSLQAQEITLDVGAAECDMQGLTADTVGISVGAGSVELAVLDAGVLSADIGAGDLTANEVLIGDSAEISIGMGGSSMRGTINGNVSVDCGMGSIQMELAGEEDDFNYDISSGMGSVEIGDNSFTSMDMQLDNDAAKDFELYSGMGSVTIEFMD